MADRPFPPCAGVTHRFVDAGGVRLHVAEAGDSAAPPVVLLHGWPQHWWLWREVIPALAADHRVLAVDSRGAGWSEVTERGYEKAQLAADVLALLDAEGIEQVDLAGHDWGGWAAQLLALKAPGRVRRLALLNISPVWLTPRDVLPSLWRSWYQVLLASPFGPSVQRGPLFEVAMRRQGIPAAAVAEFAGALREPGRALAASKLYRAFLARESPLMGCGAPARLSVPTRVLFGARDVVITPRMLAAFPRRADDVSVEVVPDCGHFIVDERPELVTGFLRDWFAPAG